MTVDYTKHDIEVGIAVINCLRKICMEDVSRDLAKEIFVKATETAIRCMLAVIQTIDKEVDG